MTADDGLEPLPPSLQRTWGDTTTMGDRMRAEERRELPDRIGLCPSPWGHADEFYVPHTGICPAAGCRYELVEYQRDQVARIVRFLTDAGHDAAAAAVENEFGEPE